MNWSIWPLWSLRFFSSAWFSARTRKLACQTLLGLTLLVVLPCSRAARVDVYASTIYTGTQAVGAVTCADFDPVHPGKELACFLADGSILELALGPTGWTATNIFSYHGGSPLWRDPTMRVSLKVGKVLPNVPGQQLVLSYFQQVFAVYYTIETGWTNQIISDQSANLGTSWDADVGPCDPTQSGDQVFSLFEAVYDFSSGTIYGNRDGVWKENFVYYAEVGMGVAIGNTNPDHSGNEIVVTTEMGPTYEILPPPTGGPGPWPMRTLWDDFENAGWVVKIGDVDPDTAGNEVIYGSRYSDSIMLSRYNGTNQHDLEILFTGVNTNTVANNIFDIAIGQIVPKSPGKQIVGVDESGSVYLVQKVANQWQGSILWQDKSPLYAVLAADLLPTAGDEVVVAGASGTITLLSNPAPALNLVSSIQGQILSWTGIPGLTYTVETTTNLFPGTPWEHLADLPYQDSGSGPLAYTNAPSDQVSERFFRVRGSH